jgi:plastocyanin
VQTPGDCKRAVCDAQGGVASVDDATDAGDDGNACTEEVCGPEGPATNPAALGTTCSSNGGKVCDGTGQCVECNDAEQCAPEELCSGGACVPASCSDGVKNGDETALDCGGSCNGCPDGQACLAGGDCANGYCNLAMQCATPTCTDGAKNGSESDIDCGGMCPDCANGKSCAVGADCASGYCNGALMCATPTCTDGVKNGAETGTDCGGPCGDCANGQGCLVDADCASGHCLEGQCDDLNGCTLATSLDATSQANVVVTFESYSYTPRCLRVKAGTNVTFSGSFPAHPLFGGYLTQGNTFASQGGPFVPMTNTGNSKSFAMNTVGAFPYYCVFHTGQDMAGAVYVVP